MAQLVLGLGTSHSPQLSTRPEFWAARGERDRNNPELIGVDGIVSGYDDLMARIDASRIAKEITPEKFKARHERNQAGHRQGQKGAVRRQSRHLDHGRRRPAGILARRQYAGLLRLLGR